ncbi:hypothetical protein H5968_09130 [Sphaerospermopsis sp. LEGE 00249]|uniref:hypothetical protein n=1 Tax=Sphaerospermopsis sp. LEGE 00249 TaxID=1380707 RepID=UPI00164E6CD2|nr:hypothetical protein [Sphaerospermopsis sp. LEGE 00249]MBC5795306.1 hypothetical protein [Sphaerospermopsis sp. LEGE 00249]
MSSPNIEIHEFSTGIHIQKRDNGWVSLGFTGQYMNATINPIPQVVERAIANQEFALTEGASSEKPAIIGRVVGSGDDAWCVIAVVTRGEDEVGRSAAFYRYFLCKGDNSYLRYILAWWEQNQKPRFNPLDVKDSPHLFTGETPKPDHDQINEYKSLPFAQQKPIVLPVERQIDLYTLNSLAIRKPNESKNGLPVSWAFNVEALVKPERFQIIQPASQKAYDGLTRAIANASQIVSAVNFDEAALKAGIRSLMNSSQVKPEAVEEIVKAVENEEVTDEYWENLFNGQGADKAIKQKIYSPQMVRLMTIRAMVLPETLPQFLAWLKIQPGKKPDENQMMSLELQKAIRKSFPKEQLSAGIKYLLPKLLDEKISVDSLSWLLAMEGSAWVYAQKEFFNDIKYDLQLIHDHCYNSNNLYPNSVLKTQIKTQNDSWQNNLKCEKEIWEGLIRYWKSIQYRNWKIEGYQPLAELFENFKEYDLAAYFYQIQEGEVKKDLFDLVTDAPYRRRSSSVVFGLSLVRKKNLIDHAFDFIIFIVEYDMKLGLVVPLSLVILVSGWFIGTKTWQSSTSATDIEKSLCSKTFNDPQENKDCQVILRNNDKLTGSGIYPFNEIKTLIPAIVNDVVEEKINTQTQTATQTTTSSTSTQTSVNKNQIKEKVSSKLEEILEKSISEGEPKLQYADLSPDKESTDLATQQQWVRAIYIYQINNKIPYQKIAVNNSEKLKCFLWILCSKPKNDNSNNQTVQVKNSKLYKKLTEDIKDKVNAKPFTRGD